MGFLVTYNQKRAGNNNHAFSAPLTSTIVPEKGSGVATFTRATTATLTDFEGLLITAKSGEVRFEGARRVSNLITVSSENIVAGVGAWLAGGGASTITGNSALDPDGNMKATTITTNSVANSGIYLSFLSTIGRTQVFSVWLKGSVGGEVVLIGDATSRASVTLTTSWRRYVNTAHSMVNEHNVIYSNSTAITFYVAKAMLTDVTGQSNQNPSEYVSVGAQDLVGSEIMLDPTFDDASKWTLIQPTSGIVSISGGLLRVYSADGTYANAAPNLFNPVVGKSYILTVTVTSTTGVGAIACGGVTNNFTTTGTFTYLITATTTAAVEIKRASGIVDFSVSDFSVKENLFHGANVDGVEYFNYENGNTVSSNVVSETTGAAISESTLKGARIEVSSINLVLMSERFDNASWSSILATTIIADAINSPDGGTKADKINETVATSRHSIGQNVTVVSGSTYTISVYAKAAERSWIWLHEDTAAQSCYFNLSTGTIGTASGCSGVITSVGNGWYRLSMTYVQSGTVGRVRFGISTGDSTPSYLGVAGNGIYLFGAQIEALSMPTSYIPTTTATVTRNADVLTFPNAGNVSNTEGTVFMDATPAFDIPNSEVIGYSYVNLIDFGSSNGIIICRTNMLRRYDGATVVLSPAWIPLKNTTYKIASRYSTAGQRNWLNRTAGTNESFDGSINSSTNMTIGGSGVNATFNWGGNIKNLKIWKKGLSDTYIASL